VKEKRGRQDVPSTRIKKENGVVGLLPAVRSLPGGDRIARDRKVVKLGLSSINKPSRSLGLDSAGGP